MQAIRRSEHHIIGWLFSTRSGFRLDSGDAIHFSLYPPATNAGCAITGVYQ